MVISGFYQLPMEIISISKLAFLTQKTQQKSYFSSFANACFSKRVRIGLWLSQDWTWDPLLQCLYRTNISSNNKIQRNYKRLKITVYVLVAQSCPTHCDPIDCSPPGSSVHGIPQERILEWLPFPSPGDLPDSGIKSGSPTLQADYLPSEPPEKPMKITVYTQLKQIMDKEILKKT